MNEWNEHLMRLTDRLDMIEQLLREIHSNAPTNRFSKDWFTIAESAEMLNRAEFTVREWCRNGRVNARKRSTGRGRTLEWMLSRKEIERIMNCGLLPRNL